MAAPREFRECLRKKRAQEKRDAIRLLVEHIDVVYFGEFDIHLRFPFVEPRSGGAAPLSFDGGPAWEVGLGATTIGSTGFNGRRYVISQSFS